MLPRQEASRALSKPNPTRGVRPSKRPGLGLAVIGVLTLAGLAAAQTLPSPSLGGEAPSSQPLSESDAQNLRRALSAARAGSAGEIRSALAAISTSRRLQIALWTLAETAPASLSYLEPTARRDLAGWPHAEQREMAAEAQLGNAGLGPRAVLAWFAGDAPKTLQGALGARR